MKCKNRVILAFNSVLIFLTLSICIYGQGYSANAARTIFSDDAYPVGYRQAEIEFGWTLEKLHWTFPTLLKYSPLKGLELGLSFDGIMVHDGAKVNETKVGNLGAQFKWRNFESGILSGAAVGGVSFSKDFLSDYLLYYTLSLDFERTQINVNGGGSLSEGEKSYSKSFLYAVSIIPKFKGNFGFYIEFHGEVPSDEGVNLINFGTNYALSENTVIDAGYRFSVSNPSRVWAFTMGATVSLFRL